MSAQPQPLEAVFPPFEDQKPAWAECRAWIEQVLAPAVLAQGRHPCALCTRAEGQLPLPAYAPPSIPNPTKGKQP